MLGSGLLSTAVIKSIPDLDAAIASLSDIEAKAAVRGIYLAVYGSETGGVASLAGDATDGERLSTATLCLASAGLNAPGTA